MVNDYIAYSQAVFQSPKRMGLAGGGNWVPPQTGWVKVNTDAHMVTGGVGSGVVVRDEMGRILAAEVRKMSARWEVEMAEAAAAKEGLRLATSMGRASPGSCWSVTQRPWSMLLIRTWLAAPL